MSDCPFCARIASGNGLVADEPLAVAFADGYPVSDRHLLVVSRRHVARPLELEDHEWDGVMRLARRLARELGGDGVNVGLNDGEAAGQTVAHAHVHVIARTVGDVADPRGGVRWVLPERAAYWTR